MTLVRPRLWIPFVLGLAFAAPAAAQTECVRPPSPPQRPADAARDSLRRVIGDSIRTELMDAARAAGISEPAGIVFVDVQNRRTGAARVWSFGSNVADSLSRAVVLRRAPLLARWPDREGFLNIRLDRIEFPADAEVECMPVVLNGAQFSRDLQREAGRLPPEPMGGRGRLTVHVKMLVTRDGEVAYATVSRRSTRSDVDRRVRELAERLRFTPAHVDGVTVDVWVEQPVEIVIPAQ